jgi:CheY-like chemotaxis protein
LIVLDLLMSEMTGAEFRMFQRAHPAFWRIPVVVMSARPGRVSKLISIDLPQPRSAATREDPRFFELATEVREALHLGGGYDLPLAATGLSEGAA